MFLDELHHPSVKLPSEEELAFPDPESALVAAAHAIPAWTEPYLAYLLRGELPEEEVKKIQLNKRCKSPDEALLEFISGACPLKKADRLCRKFT